MPAGKRKPPSPEELALVGEWRGSPVDAKDEFVFNYWTRLKNSRAKKIPHWGPWLFRVKNDGREPDKNEYDNSYSDQICWPKEIDWAALQSSGAVFSKYLLTAIKKRRSQSPAPTPPVFVRPSVDEADPRVIVLTRAQMKWRRSVAACMACNYIDGDPAHSYTLDGFIKEKLFRWPRKVNLGIRDIVYEIYSRDTRFRYFCHNKGSFDPIEPLLNRVVVAYFQAIDEIKEETERKTLETAKPTYPVTIDVGRFAQNYRSLVKSIISKVLRERKLDDIPHEDIKQLERHIIYEYLLEVQKGKIKARYGINSHIAEIKTITARAAGKFCKKYIKEQLYRAEPPESDSSSVVDTRDDSFRDDWMNNLEDSRYAGRRKKDKTLGVPDSHSYGQHPEAALDRQEAWNLTIQPLGKRGKWLALRAASAAWGDRRAAEEPYDFLFRYGFTKNEIQKALQTAYKDFCILKYVLYDRPKPVRADAIPQDRQGFKQWLNNYCQQLRQLEQDKQLFLQRFKSLPIQPGRLQKGKKFKTVGYKVPKRDFDPMPIEDLFAPWEKTLSSLPDMARQRPSPTMPPFQPSRPRTPRPYRDKKTGRMMPPLDEPIFEGQYNFWLNYKWDDYPGCGTIEPSHKRYKR